MSDSPYIFDVTEENFAQIILSGSQQVPVLVDFWAEWCNPCQVLMPILAKLADEYQGKFILAKINSDEQQNIAAQLGVRNLPTVKLFKDGQPIDEFSGALPESEIRAFLDKYIEHAAAMPLDNRVEQAMVAFEQGDIETAKNTLEQVINDDPDNKQAVLTLGQVAIADADYETAKNCLNALPEKEAASDEGLRLKGMLVLAQADTGDLDLATLEAKMQDSPDSITQYHYAIKLALHNKMQESIEALLKLMVSDREFEDDAARKCLITLFDVLGADPLVNKYRRRMFNLLH